jgi:hypothetical protein
MPYALLIKFVAIVALLGGVWWGGDRHGHRVEQQEQAEAREQARENVAMVNKAQNFKAQEVDHAQEVKRAALARALDAARDDVQRLRDATSGAGDLPGAAADPGLAAYAADGDRLLAECAERYRTVDGAKASLASRLGDLQKLIPPADTAASSVATDEMKDDAP